MLLSMRNISFSRSNRELLDSVDLDLQPGELVGLIGPNGAGKSTLLSIAAGLLKGETGQVELAGKPLEGYADIERSQLMAWVEQNGPINWPLTVERLVTLGRLPHVGNWQKFSAEDEAAITKALRDTDCLTLRHRIANTLSGGERTRVLMARALAGEPQVLLADEPVAALDLGHQLQTMELLREFSADQRGCVVVLHELSLAARYCDRLFLMHEGRMVSSGSPVEVLSRENLQAVYGVEAAVGCDEVPWIVPIRRIPNEKT